MPGKTQTNYHEPVTSAAYPPQYPQHSGWTHSPAVYRRICEAVSCGLVVLDQHGQIQWMNGLAKDIFARLNYLKDDIAESHGDREDFHQYMVTLFSQVLYLSGVEEIMLPLPDGQEFLIKLVPLYDDDGMKTGSVFILTDNTFHRKFREGEQRARMVLDNISDAVITVDMMGRISEFNRGAENITGYSRSKVIGQEYSQLFAEQDTPFAKLAETLQTGCEYTDCEVSFTASSGQQKTFLITTSLLRSADNLTVGAIGIYRNVSERKQIEEKMRLADKLAVVGELAAGTAHEIRNPLTSIKGFIQLLYRDYREGSVQKEYMDIIFEELARVEQVIKELLLLAKPSAPHLVNTDLRELIEGVTNLLYSESMLNNVKIITHCEENLPSLTVDPEQIKQVFINIACNAVQAMPKGGQLTIRAWYNAATDQVHIAFADTGIGISEENLRKISDPFFTTKECGTGLGLTVSYRIIANHRGQIDVESQEGKGTVFTVRLPVESGKGNSR